MLINQNHVKMDFFQGDWRPITLNKHHKYHLNYTLDMGIFLISFGF